MDFVKRKGTMGEDKVFSDQELKKMIVPLFLEQLLVMLVGLADTDVSVASTVAVRLFLSYLLGVTLQMGVIGIALAMVCDW